MKKNKNLHNKKSENALLKSILADNITQSTYSELARLMRENGFESYVWESAKADLSHLGIVSWTNRRKKPVIANIDLDKARYKAKQRGIDVGDGYKVSQASKIGIDVVFYLFIECKIREFIENRTNLDANRWIRKNNLVNMLFSLHFLERSKSRAIIENMIEDCYLSGHEVDFISLNMLEEMY